jgi:predicted phage terminase large subunit-like protein
MRPDYQVARHLKEIAEGLHAVERGDIDRLMINVPPRHGKSELASVHYPAWVLGRHPDWRIILGSYSASLAYAFSRRARNLLSHPLYPFDISTAGDLSNVQRWDIQGHRGGFLAAGVGGGIAGHGANLLIVDDPISGAEQADSAAYRDRAWQWFTQDAMTRLEPGGSIVMIGTRWHVDDPFGRALEGDEAWHHIDLQAVTEWEDGSRSALWPARYDLAALDRLRAQLGERAFLALFQQEPAKQEGAILKRADWQFWEGICPPLEWMVTGWDTAFKPGQENDWSVGMTVGLSNGSFYALDRWRAKVEFPDLKRGLRAQFIRWNPDEVVVEDAASGQSLIQEMKRTEGAEATWRGAPLIPVVPFKVDPSKTARVHAISPYVEGHRVYLPADAPWLDEFMTEATDFPTGKHDDQVDAFAIAMLRLIVHGSESLTPADPALLRYFPGLPG